MSKRTIRKWAVRIASALLLAVVVYAGLMFYAICTIFGPSSNAKVDKPSAIKCTCEWARLAPFPKSSKDIKIDVIGSSFTREFVVEFTAPRADIEKWLKTSPGTKHQNLAIPASGEQIFEIKPGGGAQFAEVVVSDGGTRVRIRTY